MSDWKEGRTHTHTHSGAVIGPMDTKVKVTTTSLKEQTEGTLSSIGSMFWAELEKMKAFAHVFSDVSVPGPYTHSVLGLWLQGMMRGVYVRTGECLAWIMISGDGVGKASLFPQACLQQSRYSDTVSASN